MTFTHNEKLESWVNEVAHLTKPDRIQWCNGSDKERAELIEVLEKSRTIRQLSTELRPDSYWCTSDPADTARVEDRTFICSKNKDDAGPTNNWEDPDKMKATLTKLFNGSMRGRTMYVVPFSMGPVGSKLSALGVEITDSAYVALSMGIMTHMGERHWTL